HDALPISPNEFRLSRQLVRRESLRRSLVRSRGAWALTSISKAIQKDRERREPSARRRPFFSVSSPPTERARAGTGHRALPVAHELPRCSVPRGRGQPREPRSIPRRAPGRVASPRRARARRARKLEEAPQYGGVRACGAHPRGLARSLDGALEGLGLGDRARAQ